MGRRCRREHARGAVIGTRLWRRQRQRRVPLPLPVRRRVAGRHHQPQRSPQSKLQAGRRARAPWGRPLVAGLPPSCSAGRLALLPPISAALRLRDGVSSQMATQALAKLSRASIAGGSTMIGGFGGLEMVDEGNCRGNKWEARWEWCPPSTWGMVPTWPGLIRHAARPHTASITFSTLSTVS